ncbi:alcohol-forming fatty acyl-CoA reductase-like [Tasmannia lanceolata]
MNVVFVEKLLRVQPHMKRLFLLIRATNDETARQRLQNDVMEKEVFRILREKHGKDFYSFIWDKVTPVAGDIACENLGIEEKSMKEEMWREINVIVNVAATTNFDERYDVSLITNTMGAKHVLEFAKKCVKLEILLHVSTAYVSGEKAGLILEKPFHMGETLNGIMRLDIEAEMKLANERLRELRDNGASRKAETIAMKELGIQRTLDVFIVNYGKGKLRCVPIDRRMILDVIPGDMVVNAMMVSMVAHSNQPSLFIYQIGSSVRNPFCISMLIDSAYHYFSKNPCITDDGKPIRVSTLTIFNTMASFRRYMTLRYKIPLKGLGLANVVFFQHFNRLYRDSSRKYNFIMRLMGLYERFFFFKGRFDDFNSEKFRAAMKDDGMVDGMFCFDPKCIDWEEYLMKIHIPGVVKYLLE